MDFKLKVSPSLLAADYGCLAEAAMLAESGGADSLHIDFMDGHYVPNISFGLELIPALKKKVGIPLISHLMISNPVARLDDFIKTRTDYIIIQEDTVKDMVGMFDKIRGEGIKPGFAVNPDRPLKKLYKELFHIDYLLILGVFPGFGGQTFIEDTLRKMEEAYNFRLKNNLTFDIAVDGGVNRQTSEIIVKTGANVLVAGTAIFAADDMKKAITDFHSLG